MSGRRGTFLISMLSMLLSAGVMAPRDAGAQDGEPGNRITRAQERITELLDAMKNEGLPVAGRSMALDEAIELRAGMITGAPDDPRIPSWHADQAEDLLLKRIEFPNSWSTHLLNAEPGCRIVPEEIPVIIARGIEEAGAARRTAAAAVERLEVQPPAGRNERLLGQLRFERDVRAPLLESIGLILASPIERTAAGTAFDTLSRLSRAHAEDPSVARVIRHWLTIAGIESGRVDELGVDPTEVETLDELDRIRAAMRTGTSLEAATLAATEFASTPSTDRHRRLLAADLYERALDGTREESHWAQGRGRLWITLLDDESGRTDRSYDEFLATRLARLAGRFGEEGMPLGAAWALGERELVARAGGEPPDDRAVKRLEDRLGAADPDTPGRARALGVRARLAIADKDRLAAARTPELLYLEHPEALESDPCVVADLLRPTLGLAVPWVGPSYRRALRTCIDVDR